MRPNLVPSSPVMTPKTYSINFECKIKCRKRTTFAVVLEGRLHRDEDEIRVTKYEIKLI